MKVLQCNVTLYTAIFSCVTLLSWISLPVAVEQVGRVSSSMAPIRYLSAIGDSTVGSPSATSTDQSSSALSAVTVAGICACVIVVLAVVGLVIYLCIIRKRKVESKPKSGSDRPEPHTYLRELTDTDSSVDLKGLRAVTERILDGESKTAEEVLEKQIISDDSEHMTEMMRGGLRRVVGCRYPRMEIRRDSQLILTSVFPTKQDCLHISKMSDYNGHRLLLSQAPKRIHFAYHWRAIWQEKVGLVVWMGNMVEGALKLMDNYIELFAGDQAVYGPFRVITTSTPRKLPEYDEYRVTVRRKDDERKLIFVHEHVWPLHGQSSKPKSVADLVQHIIAHQRDQAILGLPAILIHDSSGIETSPALASVYIGYQMCLISGKVNLLGIMRYISHQRWSAFYRPNAVWHVKTAFATMLILMERAEKENTEGRKMDMRSCQRRVEELGRATG